VVVIVALAVFAIRLLGDGDEAAEEPGVVTVTPEGGEGAPVGTEGDPEVEEPGEAPGEDPVEGGEPDVPPEEGDGEVAGEEGDEGGEVELPRKEVRVEVLIEPMPPQPGQPYRVQLAVANTLGVTIEVRSYQLVKPELRPALGVDLDRFLMDPISLASSRTGPSMMSGSSSPRELGSSSSRPSSSTRCLKSPAATSRWPSPRSNTSGFQSKFTTKVRSHEK
jgi:hypothetical protein